MNIFANTVVTLTFELFDADGTLLEETDEPIAYLHGGHSGMLPKLEEALNHKKAGDAVSVTLEPADGFGDYDPELVQDRGASTGCPPTSRSACSSRPTPSRTTREGERHGVHGHRHRRRQGRARRQPPVGRQAAALRLPDPRRAPGDRTRRSSTATCTAPAGITTERPCARPPRRRRAATGVSFRRRASARRARRARRAASARRGRCPRSRSRSARAAASASVAAAASVPAPRRRRRRGRPARAPRGVELVEPREIALARRRTVSPGTPASFATCSP